MKLTLRCKMQDNGIKQCLGERTISECRKLFECGVNCADCPCLEVKNE